MSADGGAQRSGEGPDDRTRTAADAGQGAGARTAAQAPVRVGASAGASGADAERAAAGPAASAEPPAGPETSPEAPDTAETAADDPEVPAGGGTGDPADGSADEPGPVVRDAISAPDAEGRPRRTTRRFPLFTRDTARPEGGGRAAPGDAPAPARQWPILGVLTLVGIGLLLTALDVFRFGMILIGAALLAGAVLRWILPSVGMLAVRSRFTDMITYGVLGTAIVLLALMAQPDPVLVIPFLDDTLHFTVR